MGRPKRLSRWCSLVLTDGWLSAGVPVFLRSDASPSYGRAVYVVTTEGRKLELPKQYQTIVEAGKFWEGEVTSDREAVAARLVLRGVR